MPSETEDDADYCREGNEDHGTPFELFLTNKDCDGQSQRFPDDEAAEATAVGEGIHVDQRNCGHIQTCDGNHGDGGRTESIEGTFYQFVLAELSQETGNNQDDDDAGCGEREAGQNASQDACSAVACIGGHVDAYGARGGL